MYYQNKVENMVLGILDNRHKKKMPIFKVIKRNKYGAQKCQIDGYTFDSKKEAYEYHSLKLRERAGEIDYLMIHPTYSITLNNQLICKVELDFEYFDKKLNKHRYIDVKGYPTEISKLKRKLIEAQYNIKVEWI